MKNIGNIMKQAQAMQARMKQMQDELAKATVTGQAGGGMVQVTMTGQQQVQQVKIDPASVDPEDVEMLEDLVVAALNDAQAKVQAMTQERMAQLTGGMNIPGLNLPF